LVETLSRVIRRNIERERKLLHREGN
jgi:hypothetical protein